MRHFVPDLIILSAGFDAHSADPLGRGTLNLQEADFFWATQRLVEVANLSAARVVSVLEGGYDPKVLASCCVQHVEALCLDTGRSM
jgi:acetoin utilization deacetylase AcuC-like enzyme